MMIKVFLVLLAVQQPGIYIIADASQQIFEQPSIEVCWEEAKKVNADLSNPYIAVCQPGVPSTPVVVAPDANS